MTWPVLGPAPKNGVRETAARGESQGSSTRRRCGPSSRSAPSESASEPEETRKDAKRCFPKRVGLRGFPSRFRLGFRDQAGGAHRGRAGQGQAPRVW